MHETPEELDSLQRLLDASAAAAGEHLRDVITGERRMSAAELSGRLQGMCLLTLATATSDGRPLVGPVDAYLIHGAFHFSSARSSVRMRHLARRPALSAACVPSEQLAVTVHGRGELFEVNDPAHPELRQAMLDWYLPSQGAAFADWLEHENPVGARIEARKMFTLRLGGARPAGYHAVTSRMVVRDLDGAVEFLRSVFDASGEVRPGRPAELRLGDSLVLVSAAGERDPFPAFLYVYVEDPDAAYRRSLEAGAVSLEAPLDTPYGDRRAMVRDPFGNVFQIARRIEVHRP